MNSQAGVPAGATVIVTTGTQAKFFINKGTASDLNLSFVGSLEPADLNDDGPAGKSAPDTPKAEHDEATFSKQLANHLFDVVHGGEMKDIVLVADPDTLGELRPLLHKEVQEAIVLELAKTLINHSLADIEKSLKAQ